jgi:hypothetical protein
MPDVKLAQGAFPEGLKVKAVRRTGDWFAPDNQDTVATATVSATEGVVFEGLEHGPYWLVGQLEGEDAPRAVRFSAEDKPAEAQYMPPQNERHDPSTVAQATVHQVVTGPRGSKIAGRFVEMKPERQDEPNPHANQSSVPEGTPQRSDTPLGQATPAPRDEPQPRPRQDQVSKGTQQRSDTPLGEATPLHPDAGPQRQEDVAKNVAQRSATQTGEATPMGTAEPRGTASNPTSIEQAEGVRPASQRPIKTQRKPSKAKVRDDSKAAAKAQVRQAPKPHSAGPRKAADSK